MKKLLGILTLAIIALAVFIMTKKVDKSSDVTLASMTTLNTANAECAPYDGIASGKCLQLSGVCVFAVTYKDCNPYGSLY